MFSTIKYANFMKMALLNYNSADEFISLYGRVPKFRDATLDLCWEIFQSKEFKNILEIGTSRSFVDGKFPGCNIPNSSYWEVNRPEVWDWGAGIFTRVLAEEIEGTDKQLTTVDLSPVHIEVSRTMTKDLNSNIKYIVSSSEDYLNSCSSNSVDWLYMDTGDVTPIEETAQLHLREAKIIVEKNIISNGGILLIDDVRCPTAKRQNRNGSDYGKAKYSIPYFIKNGFEMKMDEYQVVLTKIG